MRPIEWLWEQKVNCPRSLQFKYFLQQKFRGHWKWLLLLQHLYYLSLSLSLSLSIYLSLSLFLSLYFLSCLLHERTTNLVSHWKAKTCLLNTKLKQNWKNVLMYLKNGLLFVYFRSFQTRILQKIRLQPDSNSDHRSWRRACWPFDHHHGPIVLSI